MLLINIFGLLLIGLIVWWFWLYRGPETVGQSSEPVSITVADGVYQPALERLGRWYCHRLHNRHSRPDPNRIRLHLHPHLFHLHKIEMYCLHLAIEDC